MYIKLNDEIINLDLIKSISKVCAFLCNESDGRDYDSVIEEENVARWLEISTTGNESQRKYHVEFGFQIRRLNEKWPQSVKVGMSRADAEKAREALATLLNGNQPIIHEIKF